MLNLIIRDIQFLQLYKISDPIQYFNLIEFQIEYFKISQMVQTLNIDNHIIAQVKRSKFNKIFQMFDLMDFEMAC
jgi:hypothetical protein